MEFNVGDVVFLKSNPERLMTVSIVLGKTKFSGFKEFIEKQYRKMGFSDGDVHCAWFDGQKYYTDFFKSNTIKLKSSNPVFPVLEIGETVFIRSNPESLLTVTAVVGKPEFDTFLMRRFERKARKLGYIDGDVQCQWRNGLKFKIGLLRAAMLTKKL